MSAFARGLTLMVVGYAVLVLVVYLMQRSLLYVPHGGRIAPDAFTTPGVEEVVLTTAAGHRLYSWFGRSRPGRPTILYFHGNGAGVSNRSEKIRALMQRGFGVFMLGYPGYSGSDGSPSEAALVDAAALAYRHLISADIDANELVIYGESLGSAVAVQLASQQAAAAVVLESPMDSVLAIARAQYPFLPVSWLLQDTYLSTDFIGRVQAPLLVVHGSSDAVIPIASGQRLFRLANEPKTFHAIAGAGHNNLYDFHTVDVVAAFIDDHVGADRESRALSPMCRAPASC